MYLEKQLFIITIICGHSSVVERLVANEKVEGSTPFARSIIFFDYYAKYNEFNTEELFNLAFQHQKVNNLNQAKKIYKKILSFKPNFIEAHKNLGLIFQK